MVMLTYMRMYGKTKQVILMRAITTCYYAHTTCFIRMFAFMIIHWMLIAILLSR